MHDRLLHRLPAHPGCSWNNFVIVLVWCGCCIGMCGNWKFEKSIPQCCSSFCAGRFFCTANWFLCRCSWKTFCRWWNCMTFCIQRPSRWACQISTARLVRLRWPSLPSGFISVRRHRTSDYRGRYHTLCLHTLSTNTSNLLIIIIIIIPVQLTAEKLTSYLSLKSTDKITVYKTAFAPFSQGSNMLMHKFHVLAVLLK